MTARRFFHAYILRHFDESLSDVGEVVILLLHLEPLVLHHLDVVLGEALSVQGGPQIVKRLLKTGSLLMELLVRPQQLQTGPWWTGVTP